MNRPNLSSIRFRMLALVATCSLTLGATASAQQAPQPTFFDALTTVGEDSDTEAFGVVLFDADGDGDLDAYLPRDEDAPDELWLNDGTGLNFELGATLGQQSASKAKAADLNGDGILDIFVTNLRSQPNRVYFGDGAGNFEDSGQDIGSNSSQDVVLADLNGDGNLDAAVAHSGGTRSQIWLGDANGVFTDTEQALCSGTTGTVQVGDFDGDGDLDAFCANNANLDGDTQQPDTILFNDGDGTFTDSGQELGEYNTLDAAVLDVDNDGDLDVVAACYNDASVVWINDGDGNFTEGQALSTSGAKGVAVADINNDGNLDAYFSHEGSPDALWLGDGAGGFVQSDQGGIGGQSNVQYSALGDLNGDGDIDIFQARFKQPARVLLNTPDTDEDNIGDEVDNCIETPNTDQADEDGNGVGDACQAPTPDPNPDPAPDANPDASPDANPDANPAPSVETDTDEGCGCAQIPHETPTPSPLTALLVLGAAILISTRRR